MTVGSPTKINDSEDKKLSAELESIGFDEPIDYKNRHSADFLTRRSVKKSDAFAKIHSEKKQKNEELEEDEVMM